MTSTPLASCASACSLPALTSSQLPIYEVTTRAAGFTRCTPRECAKALSNGRELRTANNANPIGVRHRAGEHASQIGGLREAKDHSRDVSRGVLPEVTTYWVFG